MRGSNTWGDGCVCFKSPPFNDASLHMWMMSELIDLRVLTQMVNHSFLLV